MKLFDLHCDTLYEMYFQNKDFTKSDLDISLDKAKCFEEYRQVLAIYSDNKLNEKECYEQFLKIYGNYKNRIPSDFTHILAIEGGKALNGKIENLDLFYSMGVRILTLVWGDVCSLGGAHDTDEGLSDFGFEVVDRCFKCGIIPDVSHASDKMFWQVYECAKSNNKSFIASHSNSRAVFSHSRNVSDEMFSAIVECGGLVGINLEPTHTADADDIINTIRHIKHFLSLGGEKTVCLGCDFDGRTRKRKDIPDISYLPELYSEMIKNGISQAVADDIFYNNANKYFEYVIQKDEMK